MPNVPVFEEDVPFELIQGEVKRESKRIEVWEIRLMGITRISYSDITK